jgi:superfamily II DNA or RNA helicase
MTDKDKIQRTAVSLIEKADGHGIIEAATGVGKTKIAIDYISKLASKIDGIRVLWVVPSVKLRDIDVPAEFNKWHKSDLLKDVQVICYDSIPKIQNDMFDLVVLDELHKITELRSEFFFKNDNRIDRVLGLTATTPKEYVKQEIIDKLKMPLIFSINIEEAQESNLISDYEITIIYVPIGDLPVEVTTKKNKYTTTERKRYLGLSKVIAMYYDRDEKPPKSVLLGRMRFIYTLKSKAYAAKQLLKDLGDIRTLVFTKSIDICNFIVGENNAHHSKAKNGSYNRFISGESNLLGVVDSINEGVNLPELDCVVIEQLNSQAREFIQRIGRGLRYRKDHVAKIYIIVSKGTQDESWLMDAIEHIPNEKIKKITYHIK